MYVPHFVYPWNLLCLSGVNVILWWGYYARILHAAAAIGGN